MIKTFKHKGLSELFKKGSRKGVPGNQAAKLRLVLGMLNSAQVAGDMGFPGSDLHPLKGDRAGEWAVKITGNFRLVFRIEDGLVYDVDLVDYHGK